MIWGGDFLNNLFPWEPPLYEKIPQHDKIIFPGECLSEGLRNFFSFSPGSLMVFPLSADIVYLFGKCSKIVNQLLM